MEASTVSIDEVRALVAERQRYDDWLGALEAKRAETPVRVYERVQADYRTRRDDVTGKLQEHVEMLTTLQAQLEERLGVVDADLAELEDARAEAMLRTAVGEFDSERWEQVRRDVESGIAEQTAARTTLVGELDEVRTLLTNARAEPVAPEQASAVDATGDVVDVRELIDVDEPLDVPAVESAHESAAQDAVQAADEAADPVSEWEAVMTVSATSDINDDVLPIDTTSQDATRMPTAEATANETDAATDNRQSVAVVPPAADDSFDDLAFLRSVVDADPASAGTGSRNAASVADQQKTLRCTDCGTMNLPTEWYCERCGGELAAF